MNGRKRAFSKALTALEKRRSRLPEISLPAICPALCGVDGAPSLNQILCGDSIAVLNDGPPEWIDLAFADPPFNIGYLYHGYNDRLKSEDYLAFSRNWMKAVHRALRPTGSFYIAIGDEYAADLCVIARRELGLTMRNWII